MSAPNDGGPAFPHAHEDYPFQHGMSLRDWFAGHVLSGLHANSAVNNEVTTEEVAVACYSMADAMLEERTKGGAK